MTTPATLGCNTGSITYEFETKTFNYDRGIRLLADVVDNEEAGSIQEQGRYFFREKTNEVDTGASRTRTAIRDNQGLYNGSAALR